MSEAKEVVKSILTSGRGEMVDAIGLGPINRKVMGVQLPSSAQK